MAFGCSSASTLCRSSLREAHCDGSCSRGNSGTAPHSLPAEGLPRAGSRARNWGSSPPTVPGIRRVSATARHRVGRHRRWTDARWRHLRPSRRAAVPARRDRCARISAIRVSQLRACRQSRQSRDPLGARCACRQVGSPSRAFGRAYHVRRDAHWRGRDPRARRAARSRTCANGALSHPVRVTPPDQPRRVPRVPAWTLTCPQAPVRHNKGLHQSVELWYARSARSISFGCR